MSTRAKIIVNGSDGSNDDVPIGVLVTLGNDGLGGELTYLWSILDQPEGAIDALSSTNVASPTFSPRKEGTYLVKLTVNASLADEDSDQVVVAVRQLRSGQRVPAALETIEDDIVKGWKLAINRQLQELDRLTGDSDVVIAWAHVGAVQDQVVIFSTIETIKAGLPGEEVVPKTASAATSSQLIGVIIGAAQVGGPVSDGLVRVRLAGLHDNTGAGDPAVGDPVYEDVATSLPTLVASARRIGTVVAHDGAAHTYRWFVDGAAPGSGGGGSFPDITDTAGINVVISVPTSVDIPTTGGGNATLLEAVVDDLDDGFQVFVNPGNTIDTGAVVAVVSAKKHNYLYDADDIGVGAGGTFNDVAISKGLLLARPPGGGSVVTGFAPTDSNPYGQIAIYEGVVMDDGFGTGGSLTLKHDTGSSAINRIRTIGGADVVIPVYGGWRMMRVLVPNVGYRWLIISVNK